MPGGPTKLAVARRVRLKRISRPGGEIPKPLRRIRRGLAASIGAVFLILLPLMILDLLGVGGDLGDMPLYAYFVLVVAACTFWHLSWKRTLRRAAAHDHLLCPDCTYDLRTLDETGTCPECGRAYEHEAVRAQWVDAERRLKRRRAGGDGAP